MRKPPIRKPRKAPPVSIVTSAPVARQFLDCGYDLKRQPDNRIVLAKGEHCVPLYAAVALNLEVCHPRMILSGAHSSSP